MNATVEKVEQTNNCRNNELFEIDQEIFPMIDWIEIQELVG